MRRRDLLAATGVVAVGATSAVAAERKWARPYPPEAGKPAPRRGATAHRIVRDFPRLSAERLVQLKAEARFVGAPFGFLADYLADTAIKPIRSDMRIFGQALTVDLPEPDLLLPSYAMKLAKPGDVLVINAYGRSDIGCFGYSMSQSALNRGMAGVVIDGATIETTELRSETPYTAEEEKRRGGICPVYARHTTPVWGGWEKPGSINVPIRFGGLEVEPGDLVIGTREGVFFIPQARFSELKAISERMNAFSAERRWLPRVKAGEIWFDIISMQPSLDALGIPEFPLDPKRAKLD